MKRFKFRFKAVEELRALELERQVKEVALAQRELMRIEAEIENLEARVVNEIKRIQNAPMDDHLNEEVRELSVNFRKEMRRQIALKRQEALEAKRVLILERRKLIERQKKKKAMEILREKDREHYYEEQNRIETREMDEISSNLWIYRKRS